jgi:hypothetical protein
MPNEAATHYPAASYAVVRIAQPAPELPAQPAQAPKGSRWPRLVALAVSLVLAAGGIQWSAAQRRDGPRIVVAPTILAEPASQAALAIQVGPPEALPNNSFLRLRGFPASVSLTEGHAIAPGSWAIPLFGLATLKAIVPAGVSGRTEISISLVGADGTTLAESKTALVIAAAPPPPEKIAPEPLSQRQATPLFTPAPLKKAPPPGPELPAEEKARAERMLAQGVRHLEQGNISAARMFFQRAAEAGLATAAVRMGATYDPTELTRANALSGVTPDRGEARKWYERARDLGARDAEERLLRLGGR